MKSKLIALILLLFSICFADSDPIDDQCKKCIDKDNSTLGMVDCLASATAQYDSLLNASYKRAMKKLSPELKESVRNAQRKWMAYRDAQLTATSDVYYSFEGTMWRLTFASDQMELVKKQALWLKFIADKLE